MIESKNYSGWIFGSENDTYWAQSLKGGQKNRFYNPIKQNQTHIKWLKQLLGEETVVFSCIVFSERCTFKKLDYNREGNVIVLHRNSLIDHISRLWGSRLDACSPARMRQIYYQLKPFTEVDEATKQVHNDTIHQRFGKPE